MPEPIRQTAIDHDLSTRFVRYGTVDGSPATNEEKVVATLTIPNFADIAVMQGIHLSGWLAFTVGTSAVTATLRLRQTNASGTIIKSSGATTVTATNLLEMSARGFDAAPGIASYALTLQMGSGAAGSAVSAVEVTAIVV